MKHELTTPGILVHYNPDSETKVSADASSHGIGAVLLQKVADQWHPVAYASRSLSETESRYAQIEKEALAATWACEKFACYIQGKTITLETDHKPLVPLLSDKHFDDLPPRVLRFHLCLMRFNLVILHIPGKHLHTADALSRAPLKNSVDHLDQELSEEIECHVRAVVSAIPASSLCVEIFKAAQAEDTVCNSLISFCTNGWPPSHFTSNHTGNFKETYLLLTTYYSTTIVLSSLTKWKP